MSTGEDLIIAVAPESALVAFQGKDGLDPFIAEVENIVSNFEHDLTTATGRKKTASLAAKVAKFKVYLDDLGKDLVSDWKAKSKIVDESRKHARDRLDEMKEIARKPLTEWENAEKDRVQRLDDLVNAIREYLAKYYSVSEDIKKDIDELTALEIDDAYQEKKAEAIVARELSIKQLTSNFERMKQAEDQAAELERLRKEAEARAIKEREEAIAKAAREQAELEAKAREEKAKADADREKREAEEARLKAEREAKDREEKAKRELELAQERIKLQAEQAELARIKAEQDAKDREAKAKKDAEDAAKAEQDRLEKEAQAREENKKHVAKIRGEAKKALMNIGVDEALAVKLILAIHSKQVPNINIIY